MTIRRRLLLSFSVIVALFAVNLVIYFWSNQKRKSSFQELQRALLRQGILASINQDLSDVQKQVALLSQIIVEGAGGGVPPDQVAQFKARLAAVDSQIQKLESLSDPEGRRKMEAFRQDFRKLSVSWRIFYENFGVRQQVAITELAVRGEPLSHRVVQELLPEIREEEKPRIAAASARFEEVAYLTDQIAIAIFAVSIVVAIGVAYRVSRHLTTGLATLKFGAELVGQGSLGQRIELKGRDELADLARAFNDMTDSLHTARKQLTQANIEMERRNRELAEQKHLSESLLLNILPPQVAEELQAKGRVDPKYFEDVTILFTDFVGFTLATEQLAAEDLVHMLHDYFTAFDEIVARYHLEKLKTIGDSYMCVAGLPLGRRARRSPSHPVDAVMAAFEMVRAVAERGRPGGPAHWQVRIGIHTGPVIAGVVGIHKFAFDIWGDSVNYSSRMESSGAANRINLSERTWSRVKDFFECEHRGRVLTKEKKEFDMYYAKGILPGLVDDPTQAPPPAFLNRYRVYFQKDPPAFPAFLLEPARTLAAES